MSKERDLLPWVLGAVLAIAVAVAIAAVTSGRTPAPVQAAPMAAARATRIAVSPSPAPSPEASPLQPPAVAAASSSGPSSDQAAQQSSEPMQTALETTAQRGQIWECTTRGIKTFSNNPCGDKSTLLEIEPINTMNPTPVIHYARTYAPEPPYAPSYAQPDSSDQESYSDQAGTESGGNSYVVVRGVGFIPRRHPEHSHRRPMANHHNFGPMPRK